MTAAHFFKSMELIALTNFSPDCSRKLKKNERFEISASSARLLIAMKKARLPDVATDSDPKRKYKRRDMQAEG